MASSLGNGMSPLESRLSSSSFNFSRNPRDTARRFGIFHFMRMKS
jgi:hypothetical protein